MNHCYQCNHPMAKAVHTCTSQNQSTLKEILDKYREFILDNRTFYTQEKAHSAILDLFKSLVPEEKIFLGEYPTGKGKEWNDLRKEILEKIDRL